MTARPPWLTHSLLPFESRFVEIAGHTIHYLDEGEGPTLLMLHGNPTWSFVYRHLIECLRDRFRCIALDYPGFGLSIAADGYDHLPESHMLVVEQFVERLGLDALTLFVQDWGGPIGLGFAGRNPELVRGLVIANTWAWPVADDPHFVRFSRLMGGVIGGFAIRNFNAFVNVLIPLGTPRRKLSSREMGAYRRVMSTRARREATRIFPAAIVGSTRFLADVERALPSLADKPVLICWGDRDIAFREQERRHFESIFARSQTVMLEGAGHYVQEDSPREIAAAIRVWWEAQKS